MVVVVVVVVVMVVVGAQMEMDTRCNGMTNRGGSPEARTVLTREDKMVS